MPTMKLSREFVRRLVRAYEQAALKDEYIRSTLGDVLDHMILLKQHNLITE